MTNRMWVTLFFLSCSLPTHVLSHDQQAVSQTGCISFPGNLINHACLIWIGCMSLIFFSLLGILINNVSVWLTGSEWDCNSFLFQAVLSLISFHDQQAVSYIAFPSFSRWSMTNRGWVTQYLYLPTMAHLMTNRGWVTVFIFFVMMSHQSYLIPQLTGCEWCLISRQSDESCLISWPTGCEWYHFVLFAKESHQSSSYIN